MTPPVSRRIPVESLRLDDVNPRLPQDEQGAPQPDLLRYLYDNDVLTELIFSFAENGYFESEPLIVLEAGSDGFHTVLEGNRRAAALMILHQLPPAIEARIESPLEHEIGDRARTQLREVPAVVAPDRDSVAAYLGFRHIAGPRKWDSDAKARWIYEQIHGYSGNEDAFKAVGRKVGSNARGVRTAFTAFSILKVARDDAGVEPALVDYVIRKKFGVWTRLLGTANVLSHMEFGPGQPVTLADVERFLAQLNFVKLSEVLRDLAPSEVGGREILRDSRDVTAYSEVLGEPRAISAMRESGSVHRGLDIVQRGSLNSQIESVIYSLDSMLVDIDDYDLDAESLDLSRDLARKARMLYTGVKASLEPDDL